MQFLIADTFTDSLSRLTGDEQKAVKTTAFDLQTNPAHPSLQFHKLEKAKDRRFWSVRGSRDLRLIVHKGDDSLLLCYVAHHDDAYDWAERRKLEVHPTTGAAQLVEVRETIREIEVPRYVETEQPPAAARKPFQQLSNETMLGYGVPPDWLDDVRQATDDTYLALSDHLPREAAEALLEIATGGMPQPSPAAAFADAALPDVTAQAFDHPDAQRRFRVMSNVEELERALDFPWDKWAVFLHPAQRALVERYFSGPARVSGSAGTGKTIVALHRAVFLARTNPEARVLLTTFSDPLAAALQVKLRRLISNEPRLAERLEVRSLDAVGRRLYERMIGPVNLATAQIVRDLIHDAARLTQTSLTERFLMAEWEHVVDAWQLESWEAYRDVARLGRKTRLPEKQRSAIWEIFERVRASLRERGLITNAGLFTALAAKMASVPKPPFDFAVVDEAQDVSVAQLRFLAALGAGRPNGLFLAGDLGQRIFQQPFSWKSLGVEIQGRSFTLRINYRTSHQIRSQADRLLAPQLSDVDGITERRDNTMSTFNGPPPEVVVLDSEATEARRVAEWLAVRIAGGIVPHEIGVFVRSAAQLNRASLAMSKAAVPFKILDEAMSGSGSQASLSTMHLAKGLEFRAVVVMACDDEILPSQVRVEAAGDAADLSEVYASERHLLYVACTRARDHLLVTGVAPASEFLDDLRQQRIPA
jgi:superfamily I DNA/RNA helicase/mRNA-degrading endonuclease RelE of RelBE toxin-antitoxin system